MDQADLNLLVALDALLSQGSVTGAARQLGLSASAMSRTLSRLRHATGDPLLVRAGRGLVPTPRATALRDQVHALVRDARAVLSLDPGEVDIASLERTFTLRAGEGFVERFAVPLVLALAEASPGIRLRFAPKPDKDAEALRAGLVDLEIGVLGVSAPEIRTRFIFRDHFVGVVRAGHPLLCAPITPELYAKAGHVVVSRKPAFAGPVDSALDGLGLARKIVAIVPGHPDALRIAARTDLVALVPRSSLGDSDPAEMGLTIFELPVPTPEIVVSAMWHPRFDADPAHRWFRERVIGVCLGQAGG